MNPLISKTRAQPWLGTIVEISVQGGSEGQCCVWIDEAFREIQSIHQQMSFHDEKSKLTELNRRAHLEDVACSVEVREVLRFAKDIYAKTDHAVDVTVAPVLVKRNFLPAHVTHDSNGNPSDIKINEQTVGFSRPLILDLGGLAKGYAVDRAIEKLKSLGCPAAVVNAGGDLRVYGGKTRHLLIRMASHPAFLVHGGEISNCAIATSAGYFSQREDFVPYVNPENGDCLKTVPSVTVRAESCMLADALTKFVILKNPDAKRMREFDAEGWVQCDS